MTVCAINGCHSSTNKSKKHSNITFHLANNTYQKTMKNQKVSKWYFGGLAAAGAASFTHPLDLLKVQLQTQKGKNVSLFYVAKGVVKNQGISGLYSGISAAILRQLTYSLTRFAIYETARQRISKDGQPISFLTSVALAGLGGCAGGFVGTPADVVNVRMQNDVKLPPHLRRNYKNAIHGLYTVFKNEGLRQLWAGASLASSRAVLMNIGQLAFYEKIKEYLLKSPYFIDNVATHITAAVLAGGIATTMTQPVDVVKTRAMNAKKGEVKSILQLIVTTGKEGPLAFFKGYIPAFVRLAPHSILTFVFLEQLRLNFGDVLVQ